MHICLLTEVRIFEVAFGGVPKHIHSLSDWLLNQNQEVTLMGAGFASVRSKHLSKSTIDHEYKKLITGKKIPRAVHPPYIIFLVSRLLLSLLWVVKILLLNRSLPITLIHVQDTGYAGLAAVVSGKLLRIPVIASAHGLRHESLEKLICGRFRKVLLKFEKLIESVSIKYADKVIIVNSLMKSYYDPLVHNKIDIIPIPIKIENYSYSEVNRNIVRRELGIYEGIKVIGYVGRFDPEKNLITLLISFADAVKNDPLKVLVLVGTGSLESKLREYAIKYGIEDKVIFSGVRDDIGRILASLDIFVLPSYTEGLSMALLEAMACSRAVICSNIPYNHELVSHEQEALLFNPYKPEELKLAIQLLCKDDSLRLKLGQNAKLRASQYSEDMIFPKMMQFYKNLVGEWRKN
jgi:glycosyltransferase involved in cell wall biosynthesis